MCPVTQQTTARPDAALPAQAGSSANLPPKPESALALTPEKIKAVEKLLRDPEIAVLLATWNDSDRDLSTRTSARRKTEVLGKLASTLGVTDGMDVGVSIGMSRAGVSVTVGQNLGGGKRESHSFSFNPPVTEKDDQRFRELLSTMPVSYHRAQSTIREPQKFQTLCRDLVLDNKQLLATWNSIATPEQKAQFVELLKAELQSPRSAKTDLAVDARPEGASIRMTVNGKKVLEVDQPWERNKPGAKFSFDASESISKDSYPWLQAVSGISDWMRLGRNGSPFFIQTDPEATQRAMVPADVRFRGMNDRELADYGIEFDRRTGAMTSLWHQDGKAIEIKIPADADYTLVSRDITSGNVLIVPMKHGVDRKGALPGFEVQPNGVFLRGL